MAKALVAFLLLSLLAACSGTPDLSLFGPGFLRPKATEAGHFNFDWVLSGNERVAPLQVFDDGRRTWLQFAPQQTVPAIFSHGPEGDIPLAYRHEGPYVVLPGVWPKFVLRGGHLSSTVQRDGLHASPSPAQSSGGVQQPIPVAAPVEVPEAASPRVLKAEAAEENAVQGAASRVGSAAPSQDIRADSVTSNDAIARPEPLPEPASVPPLHYSVGPADATMRAALVRWARHAGWTFEPEHWAVEADIPIVGSASFPLDFEPAVQELVASTELADRPLQPCFYSNRVLRVVPYAQACDRTVGAARPS